MKDPSSPSSTKTKRKRRTISQRVGDSARLISEIGDDIVHRPGVLPGKAHGWFRTWFGKVWRVHGGGLYAVGYALTFVFLELRSIIRELAGADGVVDFFTNQLFEFLFRFFGQTINNMVQAFIWPVHVIQAWDEYGVVLLVLMFVVFPKTLKKPIERWLFGDPVVQTNGDRRDDEQDSSE